MTRLIPQQYIDNKVAYCVTVKGVGGRVSDLEATLGERLKIDEKSTPPITYVLLGLLSDDYAILAIREESRMEFDIYRPRGSGTVRTDTRNFRISVGELLTMMGQMDFTINFYRNEEILGTKQKPRERIKTAF